MTVTAFLDASGIPQTEIVLNNLTETFQLVQALNYMSTKLTHTVQAEVKKTLPPSGAQATLNFVNSLLQNISAAQATL